MKNEYLAIIPARKNSKRIKNKNLKKINGKTLIDRTIIEAKKCKKISQICLSTNIDQLFNLQDKSVFVLKRPNNLSTNNSSTEMAVKHCINFYLEKKKIKFKNIILLQPTSPFRNKFDIENAINIFEKDKADSLFSGTKGKLFIWKKRKNLYSSNFNHKKRQRTQDMNADFIENGAIFIFNIKKYLKINNRLFGKISFSEMNLLNSFEIDDYNDLRIAKKIGKIIL